VFLSDVWLDQDRVLNKLRVLFQGYSQAIIPLAFVLIGSFSSTPYNYNMQQALKYKGMMLFWVAHVQQLNKIPEAFNNFADVVSEFPEISQSSHFIFVPGPNDPWTGNLLPQSKIPDAITARCRSKLKYCTFSTNPCRFVLTDSPCIYSVLLILIQGSSIAHKRLSFSDRI
jgi:DNA polymerase epsilon subunit 2